MSIWRLLAMMVRTLFQKADNPMAGSMKAFAVVGLLAFSAVIVILCLAVWAVAKLF